MNTLSVRDELQRAVEQYTLDDLDRVQSVQNLAGQTMSMTYLVDGWVSGVSRFDGTSVAYTYDGGGRAASVTRIAPTASRGRMPAGC